MRRYFQPVPLLATLVILLGGCALWATAEKPDYQKEFESISNDIAQQLAIDAVPYPTDEMRDSLERRQQREKLLRFNQADKTGYLYLFNLGSREPIGYYVVKGKVSAVNSSLTNPTQTWAEDGDCGGCANYGQSAESIGDDGSFGTNEGGDGGIFFFDAAGVMHEVAGLAWHYADAPVAVWEDIPQLKSKRGPSSTSKFWEE